MSYINIHGYRLLSFPWIPLFSIDFLELLQISMEINAYQCISIGIHENLWRSMEICEQVVGNQWISMDIHEIFGFPWISKGYLCGQVVPTYNCWSLCETVGIVVMGGTKLTVSLRMQALSMDCALSCIYAACK